MNYYTSSLPEKGNGAGGSNEEWPALSWPRKNKTGSERVNVSRKETNWSLMWVPLSSLALPWFRASCLLQGGRLSPGRLEAVIPRRRLTALGKRPESGGNTKSGAGMMGWGGTGGPLEGPADQRDSPAKTSEEFFFSLRLVADVFVDQPGQGSNVNKSSSWRGADDNQHSPSPLSATPHLCSISALCIIVAVLVRHSSPRTSIGIRIVCLCVTKVEGRGVRNMRSFRCGSGKCSKGIARLRSDHGRRQEEGLQGSAQAEGFVCDTVSPDSADMCLHRGRRSTTRGDQGADLLARRRTSLRLLGKGPGGVVVRLLPSHLGEPGSIPGEVVFGFSYVGIVPDDAVGRRIFSGICCFPRPYVQTLPHTRLASPSLTLNASMLRGVELRVQVPASVAIGCSTVELFLLAESVSGTCHAGCRPTTQVKQAYSALQFSLQLQNNRRNERAGETGDPRENPPTNGIVRHDSHMRKPGMTRPGIEPGSPWWLLAGYSDLYARLHFLSHAYSSVSHLFSDCCPNKDRLFTIYMVKVWLANSRPSDGCKMLHRWAIAAVSIWAILGPFVFTIHGPSGATSGPAMVPNACQLLANCLPAWHPTANRVRFSAGSPAPQIFACGDRADRAGRCRWSAGFLGDFPFPSPLSSGAASYSPCFNLIGSRDLAVKNYSNLLIHSFTSVQSFVIKIRRSRQTETASFKRMEYDGREKRRRRERRRREDTESEEVIKQRRNARAGKLEIHKKTRLPATSFGMILTCENPREGEVHLNLRWFVDDRKMRETPMLHDTAIAGFCIDAQISIFCDETGTCEHPHEIIEHERASLKVNVFCAVPKDTVFVSLGTAPPTAARICGFDLIILLSFIYQKMPVISVLRNTLRSSVAATRRCRECLICDGSRPAFALMNLYVTSDHVVWRLLYSAIPVLFRLSLHNRATSNPFDLSPSTVRGGGAGMKRWGKQEIPEKTRQPTASSGTIPTCENPVTRPGIEPGSPWWEASRLTTQPPWSVDRKVKT
ncbi:hypothetical protein PR048_025147 [Dryococelus australis]|uniref:Uncharacterized protein n=1 Tax=Dryococelus australis TaxID=614101 RepID=A0ABQ9GQK5_9NEOP|nr:hypothetical protein PR048_025147 [Dryococelus australis]